MSYRISRPRLAPFAVLCALIAWLTGVLPRQLGAQKPVMVTAATSQGQSYDPARDIQYLVVRIDLRNNSGGSVVPTIVDFDCGDYVRYYGGWDDDVWVYTPVGCRPPTITTNPVAPGQSGSAMLWFAFNDYMHSQDTVRVIVNSNSTTVNADTAYIAINIGGGATLLRPSRPVVTPKGATLSAASLTSRSETFTIVNGGNGVATFALSAACGSFGGAGCTVAPSAISLGGGASGTATVAYATPAGHGLTSPILLTAANTTSPSLRDSATIVVTTVDQIPPTITLTPGTILTSYARGFSLTFCDADGSLGTPAALLNGIAVAPGSYTPVSVGGCASATRADYGSAPLRAGLNSLSATISDGPHVGSGAWSLTYDDSADVTPVVTPFATTRRPAPNASVIDSFTVRNPGPVAASYMLTVTSSDQSVAMDPTVLSNAITVPPFGAITAKVAYSTSQSAGTSLLRLKASYASTSGRSYSTTGVTTTIIDPTYLPRVTPKMGNTVAVSAGAYTTQSFVVMNDGTAAGTFTYSFNCTGAATNCRFVGPSSGTVAPGVPAGALVAYDVGLTGGGQIRLIATSPAGASPIRADTGFISIVSADLKAPTIEISPSGDPAPDPADPASIVSITSPSATITVDVCDADGAVMTPSVLRNGTPLAPASVVPLSRAGCLTGRRATFTPTWSAGRSLVEVSVTDGYHTVYRTQRYEYDDRAEHMPGLRVAKAAAVVAIRRTVVDTLLVSNTGSHAAGYQLGFNCDYGPAQTPPCYVSLVNPSQSSITVSAGGTVAVPFSYVAPSGVGVPINVRFVGSYSTTYGTTSSSISFRAVTGALLPTVVTITPPSGTVSSTQSLNLVVDWSDEDDLLSTHDVLWDGAPLSGGFTATSGSSGRSAWTIPMSPGVHNVRATAVDGAGHVTVADGQFTFAPPLASMKPVVTPKAGSRSLARNATGEQQFVVRPGQYAGTYAISASCGMLSLCQLVGASTRAIGAGDSAVVTVQFAAPPQSGQRDTVRVVARYDSPTGGSVADTGKRQVVVPSLEVAPIVSAGPRYIRMDPGMITTVSYMIANPGSDPVTYNLRWSMSGSGFRMDSTRWVPDTITVPAGQVRAMSVDARSLSVGTADLRLTASYTATSGLTLLDTASATLDAMRLTYAIAVGPKQPPAYIAHSGSVLHQVGFAVTNKGTATVALTAHVRCVAIPQPCGIYPFLGSDASLTLAYGASTQIVVSFDQAPDSSGAVELQVTGGTAATTDSTKIVVRSDRPFVGLAVTPKGLPIATRAGGLASRRFVVRNTGTAAANVTYLATCPGGCVATDKQGAVIAPDQSDSVLVQFRARTSPGTDTIRLKASASVPNAASDEGFVTATVDAATTVVVDAHSVTSGPALTVDHCLTIPAGPNALFECGDLRLTHALPSTTTMNVARTPTLIYSARQHTATIPFPATVSIPYGSDDVTGIRARVLVAASPDATPSEVGVVTYDWPQEWSDGTPRRITVPGSVANFATGTYRFVMDVEVLTSAGVTQYRDTGTVAVVRRDESAFGPGWWLEGLEQLSFNTADGNVLWVGGNGATRVFTKRNDSVWVVTPTIDRPDTLTWHSSPGRWRRHLGNGATAEFDNAGRHLVTVNTSGHRTSFAYSAGYLHDIILPTPTGGADRRYTFTRDVASRSVVIEAPADRSLRTTQLRPAATGFDITDLDGKVVHFGFADGRIAIMAGRTGTITEFGYDPGGSLSRSSIRMNEGSSRDIVRTFCAAESAARSSCAPTPVAIGDVQTVFDGPRIDVSDVTRFTISRFGSPTKIVAPDGATTSIRYDNPQWPASATGVTDPVGHQTEVTLNGRGLPEEFRDVNLRSLSSTDAPDNAITRYTWSDPSCNRPTAVTSAMGVATRTTYAHPTCAPSTSEDARGAASAVTYEYDQTTQQLAGVRYPETPSGRSALIQYDALGNLSATRTVMGATSMIWRDAIGNDTLTVTPLDSNGAVSRTRRLRDGMGRDTLQMSWAPRTTLNPLTQRPVFDLQRADTIVVRTWRDAEGRPDSIRREMYPNPNHIAALVTRWRYDAIGRTISERSPDKAMEFYVYGDLVNVTESTDRRGLTIRSTYDVMNRLVSKRLPVAVSAEAPGTLVVPAQVDTFTYDLAGRMTSASNQFARTTRRYTLGGLIDRDVQSIATLSGSFGEHEYELLYQYDLDGRRAHVTYPSQLTAGIATGDGAGWLDYGFSPTGALERVVMPGNRAFTYSYDLRGRLATIVAPNGVRDIRQYDEDDRVISVIQRGPSAELGWFPNDIARESRDTIHADHIERSLDGKASRVTAYQSGDVLTMGYNGLGAVTYSRRDNGVRVDHRHEEDVSVDPLGNVVRSIVAGVPVDRGYDPSSGRLRITAPQDAGASDIVSAWYDVAGNQMIVERLRGVPGLSGGKVTVRSLTHNGYDAAGRLRLVQMRGDPTTDANPNVPYEDRYNDEETRYDALGRRIWVSSAHVNRALLPCATFCSTTRFVWDGDQLIGEVRAPASAPENDVMPISTFVPVADSLGIVHRDGDSTQTFSWRWGRVIYAHGLGIDQPIAITRAEGGYEGNLLDPFTMYPHLNWRGDIGAVSFAGGRSVRAGNSNAAPAIPSEQNEQLTAFRERAGSSWAVNSWTGSLVNGQFGENGLEYRRNRYYDPSQGRFTQEDPIGLAGGLNLYGFGNGDAVSYSDPFGLCKVRLHAKNIKQFGMKTPARHAYVVTTDRDNTRTVFRGGPTKNSGDAATEERMAKSGDKGPGAFGYIATTKQPYQPGGIDYDASAEGTTLVDNDESCESLNRSFETTLGAIESKKIPYQMTGPNSNSVAYTLLLNAGINPPGFAGSVRLSIWAPGWGTSLVP